MPRTKSRTTTPTSCLPKDSLEFAQDWLKKNGWLKEVAGEEDFHKGCLALLHYCKDRRNGLLLIGEVGCGKTMLANLLYQNTNWRRHPDDTVDHRVWVDCTDALDVNRLASEEEARQFNLMKPNGSEDDWDKPIMFLDDLGRDRPLNRFGVNISLTGCAIQRFHSSWVKPYDERVYGPPTIGNHLVATTNMSLQDLHEQYGTRIMDRLLEMCAIVRFTGGSKRSARELA